LAALEASAEAYRPPVEAGHKIIQATIEIELDASGRVIDVVILESEQVA
jgi:hypothetical protein